jgi:hypothetical protein
MNTEDRTSYLAKIEHPTKGNSGRSCRLVNQNYCYTNRMKRMYKIVIFVWHRQLNLVLAEVFMGAENGSVGGTV